MIKKQAQIVNKNIINTSLPMVVISNEWRGVYFLWIKGKFVRSYNHGTRIFQITFSWSRQNNRDDGPQKLPLYPWCIVSLVFEFKPINCKGFFWTDNGTRQFGGNLIFRTETTWHIPRGLPARNLLTFWTTERLRKR